VRVGLVCPYSLSVPGGVQGQVLGLARALRALGLRAQVLAPTDGPPPEPGITPLGRSVPFAANGSTAPIAPDPAAALRTLRALRDEAFDVVHIHEPLVPGPALTSLLFAAAPLVGTFHRDGVSADYRVFGRAMRPLVRRLDVRCAVSLDALDTARRTVGGDHYELLYNGVEVERFAKRDAWPTDAPTVFFVGRHEPRKGLDVLLAAAAELPADVRIWVGGHGPQTAELQARTAGDDRIEWLGRISDDERAARLRGAHVFCAPSRFGESFGVVLLEAMAAQVAIAASDLPGYRRVAEPDEHALLVPPDDPTALAGAIRRLLTDGTLAERLRGAGEARAAEFSMDGLAERYADLYTANLRQ
jgi:phosphatidylinositol alpha-mannosyltransferase